LLFIFNYGYTNQKEYEKAMNNLKSLDIEIGRNLRHLRQARGITQNKLAEALGLTFQQIQKYETAANRISASRLIDIARVLQIDLSELLPNAETPKSTADPVLAKQTNLLLTLFTAIPDNQLRQSILKLVKCIAEAPASQRRSNQSSKPAAMPEKRLRRTAAQSG